MHRTWKLSSPKSLEIRLPQDFFSARLPRRGHFPLSAVLRWFQGRPGWPPLKSVSDWPRAHLGRRGEGRQEGLQLLLLSKPGGGTLWTFKWYSCSIRGELFNKHWLNTSFMGYTLLSTNFTDKADMVPYSLQAAAILSNWLRWLLQPPAG